MASDSKAASYFGDALVIIKPYSLAYPCFCKLGTQFRIEMLPFAEANGSFILSGRETQGSGGSEV